MPLLGAQVVQAACQTVRLRTGFLEIAVFSVQNRAIEGLCCPRERPRCAVPLVRFAPGVGQNV